MHFRVRGNSVQVVRTEQSAEGKQVSVPIGSANLSTGEMTSKLAAALSPAETEEVQAWIAKYRSQADKLRQLELETLPHRLREVADALRSGSVKAEPELLEELSDAMRGLRFQMNRAGGAGEKSAA